MLRNHSSLPVPVIACLVALFTENDYFFRSETCITLTDDWCIVQNIGAMHGLEPGVLIYTVTQEPGLDFVELNGHFGTDEGILVTLDGHLTSDERDTQYKYENGRAVAL